MRQEAQRFALVLFVLPAREEAVPRRGVTHDQEGRVGASPLEGRRADVGACGAQARPSGCPCPLHPAAIRGAVLRAWEAVERRHGVEQHEAEARLTARHHWQPIPGLGRMGLGGLQERARPIAEPCRVGGEQGSSDCNDLWHCRSGKTLRNKHAAFFEARGEPGAAEIVRHLVEPNYLLSHDLILLGSPATVVKKLKKLF